MNRTIQRITQTRFLSIGLLLAGAKIAAAAMSVALSVPIVFAATTTPPAYTVIGPERININGIVVSSPTAIAMDDAGSTTTFMPIWYLEKALTKAGYVQSYNGATHQWDITATDVDASLLNIPGGVGTGVASISINGTVVKRVDPQFVKDVDAGKHAQMTTYFPILAVGSALQAAGLLSGWDSNGFSLNVESTSS